LPDHAKTDLASHLSKHITSVRWSTPQGIEKLLAKGKGNGKGNPTNPGNPSFVSFVLEPTGRYGDVMVQKATQVGYQVFLAPPQRAKAFLNSVQDRAKTDRLDSAALALFALSTSLKLYLPKSLTVETVNQLLSAHKGLTQLSQLSQLTQLTQSIMRLQLQRC
jgi:transposase